jgi:hypothetical protein
LVPHREGSLLPLGLSTKILDYRSTDPAPLPYLNGDNTYKAPMLRTAILCFALPRTRTVSTSCLYRARNLEHLTSERAMNAVRYDKKAYAREFGSPNAA